MRSGLLCPEDPPSMALFPSDWLQLYWSESEGVDGIVSFRFVPCMLLSLTARSFGSTLGDDDFTAGREPGKVGCMFEDVRTLIDSRLLKCR